MDKTYFKQVLRIFFGFCLLLGGAVVFFLNIFAMESGFDIALLLLNLLAILGGLLLAAFGILSLPSKTR